MPKSLAAKLNAERAFGEDISDVILRLAKQATASGQSGPFR